ncbi:hypothetical protein EV363DRAFT_1455953 [Boletus edulis]|nr:hypothetical protein EV363DRAFT_1455953 [Boletus edulis]
MHPALQIQEILLNIFGHRSPPSVRHSEAAADLAVLARTCRAFKDPALDVLWEVLHSLYPLVRCLPEACHRLPPGNMCYSFHRSLRQNEWDILRSYTRRIRSIYTLSGLDRQSAQRLWRAPEPQSLFPSLRHLQIDYTRKAVNLLLIPFPSLTFLAVKVSCLRLLENSLKSLSNTSPSLCELRIHPCRVNMDSFDLTFICKWRYLHTVVCPEISLDVITFVHLSRISALTRLEFKLGDTLPDQISPFDSPLIFTHLAYFILYCESMDPISRLLSRIQFRAVKAFSASIKHRPSTQDLFSFFAIFQTSGLCHTIQQLMLNQDDFRGHTYVHRDRPVLGFQHLQPFMAFTNLRHIHLDIEWNVDLTDSELLTAVSVWPHLEKLCINVQWGWNTLGGITPNGLVQLLQTCPSLTSLSLAIDTRGYTAIPPGVKLTSSSFESINVLDSFIEEESVPAVIAFFADIIRANKLYACAAIEAAAEFTDQTFDYIVVGEGFGRLCEHSDIGVRQGGGNTGLALASLLSADPRVRVGVIEAGLRKDDEMILLQDPDYDWSFSTKPQALAKNRRIPLSRGKVLGGISALNYMAYTRHGYVKTTAYSYYYDLVLLFFNTMNKLGVVTNYSKASGDLIGAWTYTASVDPQTNTRSYSTNAYYDRVSSRPNIVCLTGAYASREVLSDSKNGVSRAMGVEFYSSGQLFSCVRALQTLQILELSGIGNINILRKLGIPLKVDLPGVGENLQDHFTVTMGAELHGHHITADDLSSEHFAHERLREYRETRRGMLSSTLSSLVFLPASTFIPADTMKRMLASLDRALQTPEIKDSPYKQWYDLQRAWLENDGVAQLEIILFPSYTHVGCTKENPKDYTLSVFLQHAWSRGTVNPARARFRCDPPEIDLATLDSPGDIDMTMLLEAIKYIFKVMQAGALGDLTAKIVEPLPTWSDDQLREYTRSMVKSAFHQIDKYSGDAPEVCQRRRGQWAPGTLAPSKRKETHVYGTANLRVADASISPILWVIP